MKRSLLTAAVFASGVLAFPFYPTAAQADVASVDLTGATLSQSSGALAVNGTIVCTAGENYMVSSSIFQAQGSHSGISAGNSTVRVCSGDVDTWEVPETPFFGSLKNGNALVLVQVTGTATGYTVRIFHQPVTPAP